MKTGRGFTLIEILVAVTIVSILAVAGVVSYTTVNRRARDARRSADLQGIRSALELYRADNGYYPAVNTSDLASTTSLAGYLVTLGYMPSLPTPPMTSDGYYYKATTIAGANYYGYCLCGKLEGTGTSNDCTASQVSPVPSYCNLLLRHP